MKTITIFLLAGLIMFSGCTTDKDARIPEDGLYVVPLQIGKAVLERESSTRAATVTDIPAGSIIGVFRRQDINYTQVSNEPYKLTGTQWDAINPETSIGLKNTTATLAAFYPFGLLPAQGTGVTLTTCLWEAGKEAFYAPFTANAGNPTASFTMKHVYSRVSVVFKRDKGSYSDSDGKITTFALTGTGIYTTAVLDVTKALTDTPFSDYATPGYSLTGIVRNATLQGEANDPKGGDCIDLLVVPGTLSGEITLKATIDGKLMSLKLDASKLGGSLGAGKRYNIAVTVKGTAIVIGAVYEAAAWGDETAGNNGNVMPMPEKTYELTQTETVLIGGVKWAKANLQQINYYTSFVANQWDKGSHWNWGIWNATITNDYLAGDNVTWEIALPGNGNQDPCTELGSDWRLPNKTELEALAAMSAPQKTKVNINGTVYTTTNGGVWEQEPEGGVYIDEDQVLFIPVTGQRRSNGNVSYPSVGFYWSSTSADGSNAYYLHTDNGNSMVASGPRAAGLAVRCVKESDYYELTAGNPVIIDGVKWARTNLVQSGTGKSAPVSFAVNPWDAGSYWNWGMRDASLSGQNDYLSGSSPWGISTPGDANQNPCRALGSGWRLPTKTELESLLNKAAPVGTRVKIGTNINTIGNNGWAPTSKCAVFMNNGQLLALPAAGYRDGASMMDQGSYGDYWSDNPGADSSNASCLDFNRNGINTRDFGRSFGASVRCVQN